VSPGEVRHVLLLSGTAQSAHNGSSRVERALADALAAHAEVTLLTRDRDRLPDAASQFVHRTYRRPSSKPWKTWLLAGQVARRIEEIHRAKPIDRLHAFGLFPVCLYAARFAAKSGVPFILTPHSMDVAPPRALAAPTLRAMRAAAWISCLAEAQREKLLALGVDRARTGVIENGIDPATTPPESGSAEAMPGLPPRFVLFAGRFEADKGVFLLLDALERIPAPERPALVLAGDGREAERVQARAAALGATALTWQPHPVLMAILARAEALVLPSFSEAAPLLPLEAFQRSIPVIAHALPALESLGERGLRLAELVPIGDRDGWATALTRIQSGEHRDEARVRRARDHAAGLHWPRIAERYLELYRSLAAR
jgi:glycosyltransferase involved in cell wall biosynthesis